MYRATFSNVARYCRRRAHNQADADDAIAATYRVAWQKFDEVAASPVPEAWLYRVARGVLSNQRRSNGRVNNLTAELKSAPTSMVVADVAAVAERDAEMLRVYRALNRLPEDDRELILLMAFRDLSHPEIAEVTGLPAASISGRMYRARHKLRTLIDKDEDDVVIDIRRLRERSEPNSETKS